MSAPAPRPHHLNTPVVDINPTDLAVEQVGGCTDVYLDTNCVTWQRVRLTPEQARQLYIELADHLPTRMPAEELL